MLKIKKVEFVSLIVAVSLLWVGMFHEYISCIMSIAMSIWLLKKIKKEKKMRFKVNFVSISILVLVGFYLLSVFWANDSGLAFIGFVKFLPLILFLLILYQEDGADGILNNLPYFATVMMLISMVGMYVPFLKTFFSVSGRLAGFFQYPNTFALFLLVAELLLLGKEKYKAYDYICLIFLVFGVLMTGSRTVFVLAAVMNVVMFVFHRNKRIRYIGICGVVLGIIAVVVFIMFFDHSGIFDRLLQISLTESTFVGRILYYTDAFPLILKRPFGVGYLSYYYMQQSIQTGVYNIRYVHNDFLQIMLDVGWIPCVLFVIAIIKTFLSKNVIREKKIVLATIVLHSCFDFNLQFVVMFLLLILLLDYDSGKEIYIRKDILTIKGCVIVAACMCLWCGSALFFHHVKQYSIANAIYPWNTQTQEKMLEKIEDLNLLQALASEMLQRNPHVTIAYSAMARCAYAAGDFGSVIQYKNALFENAPFQYNDYKEYCYMMMKGMELYQEKNDMDSYEICKEELFKTYDAVAYMDDKLSKYGEMISYQPTTILPQDIVKELRQQEQ